MSVQLYNCGRKWVYNCISMAGNECTISLYKCGRKWLFHWQWHDQTAQLVSGLGLYAANQSIQACMRMGVQLTVAWSAWFASVLGPCTELCCPLSTSVHSAHLTILHICPVCTSDHSAHLSILHIWPFCTSVHSAHLCILHICLFSTSVNFAHLSSLHICPFCNLSILHICPFCTSVHSAHLCILHICPVCTSVQSAHLSILHICPFCTSVQSAHLQARACISWRGRGKNSDFDLTAGVGMCLLCVYVQQASGARHR